jgi:hypothetical protein
MWARQATEHFVLQISLIQICVFEFNTMDMLKAQM